jgi:hypothetical protein
MLASASRSSRRSRDAYRCTSGLSGLPFLAGAASAGEPYDSRVYCRSRGARGEARGEANEAGRLAAVEEEVVVTTVAVGVDLPAVMLLLLLLGKVEKRGAGEPVDETPAAGRRETGMRDLRCELVEEVRWECDGRGMWDGVLGRARDGSRRAERRGLEARESGLSRSRDTITHPEPVSVCKRFDGRGGVSSGRLEVKVTGSSGYCPGIRERSQLLLYDMRLSKSSQMLSAAWKFCCWPFAAGLRS